MKYEKGNIKEHMVINEIYGLRKASVTVDLLNEMGWKEIIDEPEVLFKRIISMVTDFRYEVKKEEREKDWFLKKYRYKGRIVKIEIMEKLLTDFFFLMEETALR